MSEKILAALAWLVAFICIGPMIAAAVAAIAGDLKTWQTLVDSVLPGYVLNTVLLVAAVALATAIVGSGTAWLITMFRFPGSRILEFLLVLPLAFPAYVLAYAYTDLMSHHGPVQSLLRDVTGWAPREYWFPNLRSLPGAAAMLTFVLYPYVYLLARNAFAQQSLAAYMAARTLGKGTFEAFWRVCLPMARPAIVGGVLLTIMETIADYGTVSYFSVRTFSTGIYQAWFSMGDRGAAAQLALCLLAFALLLAALERAQRGQSRVFARGAGAGVYTATDLSGWRGWLASLFCAVPVLVGFVLPVIVLGQMAWRSGQNPFSPRYFDFIFNSVGLAAIAALVTVVGALMIAFYNRISPGHMARAGAMTAGLGYAVPGGVIAVGLLVPAAALDNAIDDWAQASFGIRTGLLITGSIWLLVLAYMARFMAAGLNSLDAGFAMLSPNIEAAGRTMGCGPFAMLGRVHLPIVRRNILVAGLIVFVDSMKELPATLILHPFDFTTLAVQAHRLASDERLTESAVPSLIIVAIGLLPVFVVCQRIGSLRETRGPVALAAS